MVGVRWSVLALLALTGCTEGLALSVDVKTDFVPGPEFAAVRVTLVGEANMSTVGAAGDYLSGQRAVDFEGLEANGARTVSVALIDDLGGVVAERSALVDHREDRGLTLTLARDCAGVMCPGAGAAAATACFGGRCTEPECIDGTEPSCPEPECIVDNDCPILDACSTRRCIDTLCLYAPTVGACDVGFYCSPEAGCLALPSPVDASFDAMPMMDAGPDVFDAGPAPLNTPRLTWPQNGAVTGPAASVTLRWATVPDADYYTVETVNACPAAMEELCSREIFGGNVPEPEFGVAFSGALTVPASSRYRWRIRACRDNAECGEWSDYRYFDRGGPSDFDGDGIDELLVGYFGHVTVFEYGGGTFAAVQELTTPLPDRTSSFGVTSHVGDINGDGFADAVIGAESDRGYGTVVPYLGSAGGLVQQTPIEAPPSSGLNDFFGRSLCIADFDADGFADLAVEATGGTFVYAGGADGIIPVLVVQVPGRLSTCADVNEDGRADILTGNVYYAGSSSMLVATTSAPLTSRPYFFVGDVNEDGFADFISATGAGSTFIAGNAGGVEPAVAIAGVAGGAFAFDYQALGLADVSGDGASDAVMGDVQSSPDSPGIAALSLGSSAGLGPRVELDLPCINACNRRGSAVSYGFDLNDDGFGDAAVSATDEDGIFVFFGSATGLNPVAVRVATTRPMIERFGVSL